MNRSYQFLSVVFAVFAWLSVSAITQTIRVDLGKETVGKTPTTFEPMMGTWVVAEDAGEDGGEKVIKLDGAAYRATLDTASRALIDSARKFYGTSNEELLDNAKQFAAFPIAVLRGVDHFSSGTISLKFKTVAGNSDRASGILFNVKPNGDWLAVRYNDPEHNIALWEFHNGVRRRVAGGQSQVLTEPADRNKWHELSLTIAGAKLTTTLNGATVLEYTLGTAPGPGRGGAAPNPDLLPENNPVLRPPVDGKVGLWSKGDSTSYFKDYVVSPAK